MKGEGQAKFFGWSEPFPSYDSQKPKHGEAEEMTDQLSAKALSRALTVLTGYGDFESGITALRAAMP